jgi:predicted phosphoserine aminotransferase
MSPYLCLLQSDKSLSREVLMPKLFIPGPTNVADEVLEAQTKAVIGHRSQALADLMGRIQPMMKQVFQTENRVFITASSGSGLQEGALRNCVAERLLICVCGAFGERWHAVAVSNAIPVDRLDANWGEPNTAEQVAAALQSKKYDALAIVHNETSTGVENPLADIAARARQVNSDLMILVDAVSSAAGVDIPVDEWDLDVLLTSSQKCFALPPGLAFAAVSERALQRAERIPHRGWYFDFLLYKRYLERNMTPATPAVTLLYALEKQLERILEEGIRSRFERHRELARLAQSWAQDRFALFAAEGYRSKTVTTVRNTRGIDFNQLSSFLQKSDMVLANGYGKLKGETFRIGHMGETTSADLQSLLDQIDAFLALRE